MLVSKLTPCIKCAREISVWIWKLVIAPKRCPCFCLKCLSNKYLLLSSLLHSLHIHIRKRREKSINTIQIEHMQILQINLCQLLTGCLLHTNTERLARVAYIGIICETANDKTNTLHNGIPNSCIHSFIF